MMPLDELSNIAHNWFAAFNAHDLESLLQLYHDEVTHYSPKLKVRHPETKGLIKGKYALRTWWQDAFLRLPSLKYELIRLTPYEDRVFMEYIRHVNGEEDLAVGEMLEIQAGKIIHSKVFHQYPRIFLEFFLQRISIANQPFIPLYCYSHDQQQKKDHRS